MTTRRWCCDTCIHWKPAHTKVANNVYGNVAPCTVMLAPKSSDLSDQKNKKAPFWAQQLVRMTNSFDGEGCYTWEAKP